jgi:hypothetical protein
VWLTPEGEPDCDHRLHLLLTHFATALAYAQQEDEVLEGTYMARWQADVELAHRAIMDPIHHRPLVMSAMAGIPGRPVNPWSIEVPIVTPP